MRKLAWITAALAIAIALAGFTARAWARRVQAKATIEALALAESLLEERRLSGVFDLADANRGRGAETARREWARLEVEAATLGRQFARLETLYRRSPERVLENESASALLARAYMSEDEKAYRELLQHWRTDSANPELWTLIESDRAVSQGRLEEARGLLASPFSVPESEAARLARLALLDADPSDLTASWNHLADAAAAAPRSGDIRSFRGQILERLGQGRLARVEYVAARLAEPSNPFYADQLAEFYRRSGEPRRALEVWTEAIESQPVDFIWMKAWFWGRVAVASPRAAAALAEADVRGSLEGAASVLRSLPRDAFWSLETPEARLAAQDPTAARQDLRWLRALEALRVGDDALAESELRDRPFRVGNWNRVLDLCLRRTLSYRRSGSLIDGGLRHQTLDLERDAKHRFVAALERLARREREGALLEEEISPEMDRLLRGRLGLAAACLGAGWMEAGLRFFENGDGAADESIPDWLVYGLAQAMRLSREADEAIAFLEARPGDESCQLLLQECRLQAGGNEEEALRGLGRLASASGAVGYRAAWLLALSQLDRRDGRGASETVRARPDLAGSILGRELEAKILLASGNAAEAEQVYLSIQDASLEAKSYLARRAFERADYQAAETLTLALIQELPDHIELRRNLVAIRNATGR